MRELIYGASSLVATMCLSAQAGATPAAPTLRGIVSNASHTGANISGSAEAGATVTLYTDSGCTVAAGATGTATGGGAFSISVSIPAGETHYWATATTPFGTSACSGTSIPYYPVSHPECPAVPEDLPISRAPVFWQESIEAPYYWSHDSPTELACYVDELAADRFALVGPFNWPGEGGLFESAGAMWGAAGSGDAAKYGHDSYQANVMIGYGVPDAQAIVDRIDDHRAYMEENLDGVTRAFNYTDLGTALFGNHYTCIPDPVTHVAGGEGCTGFWSFYWNDWDSYEAHGLVGARPSDPTTWLLHAYSPLEQPGGGFPGLAHDLAGLSFVYAGWYNYPPYIRYSVNIASQGWADWWSTQFAAHARSGYRASFVDNVFFQNCWNNECQVAYQNYLWSHYMGHDIQRLFTVAHLMPSPYYDDRDYSFERAWTPNADGTWRNIGTHIMIPYPGATIAGTEAPDTDSYGGSYSARIAGGGLQFYTIPSTHEEIDLTIHYKMNMDCYGDGQLSIWSYNPNWHVTDYVLPNSTGWTSKKVRVHSDNGFVPQVYAPAAPGCHLLLDEVWLSTVDFASLTPDASFDSTWVDNAPYGQRTYYTWSEGAVVSHVKNDCTGVPSCVQDICYDGDNCAKIENGSMGIYSTDFAPSDAYYDITLHYKTDGYPAQVTIWSGETATNIDLPATTTWATVNRRLMVRAGTVLYPVYHTDHAMYVDDTWTRRVGEPRVLTSFDSTWVDNAPYGQRTSSMVSQGAVVSHVRNDCTGVPSCVQDTCYDGDNCAKIEGGLMGIYSTDLAPSDGYYDIALHYKTDGHPAQVVIWWGEEATDIELPATTTWATVNQRLMVRAGTPLYFAYYTDWAMYVDDTWAQRVDEPSALINYGFEFGWHDVAGTTYNYYQGADPPGCAVPDTDAYAGAYSARIDAGSLWFQTTPVTPVDTTYDLTIHYKTAVTSPASSAELLVWAGGVPTSYPLADSETWRTASFSVSVPRGGNMAPRFTTNGTLWVDDVIVSEGDTSWLHGTDPYPTFERALPPGTGNFEDAARLTAARASWQDILASRVQWLHNSASASAGEDYELFVNSRRPMRGAKYFMREVAALGAEMTQMPETGYAPGLYEASTSGLVLSDVPVTSEVLGSNIFDLKYNHGQRFVDEFNYALHLPASFRQGDGFSNAFVPNVDSITLANAEAAAFGGGAGVDLGFHGANGYLIANRAALRASSNAFHDFVDAHEELYSCLTSTAEVGLVFHDVPDGGAIRRAIRLVAGGPTRADVGLAGYGLTWDVLPIERMGNVSRFKVLILSGVDRVSEAEAQTLLDFVTAGGTLILSGRVAAHDELSRLRAANPNTVWPTLPTALDVQTRGAGTIVSSPTDLAPSDVLAYVAAAVGRSDPSAFPTADPTARQLLRVATWRSPQREIVHVLNYAVPMGPEGASAVTPLSDLVVTVPVDTTSGWTPTTASLSSPGSAYPDGSPRAPTSTDVSVTVSGGMATFTIPSMRVYTVADLR